MQLIYWAFKVIAVGIIITWLAVSTASGRAHSSIAIISRQDHRGCPSARTQVLYKRDLHSQPLKDNVREAGYTSIFKSVWNMLMAPVNNSKQSK